MTVCLINGFESEAAIRLESLIDPMEKASYPFVLQDKTIDVRPLIHAVVEDAERGVNISIMSTRFHLAVVDMIIRGAQQIRTGRNLHKIVLSGGTFQNRFLVEKTEERLRLLGFEVYVPRRIPVSDGGIALGQLVIAAKRRQITCA